MSRRPTLQDFVDDEMLRAPMTFDQAVDTVQERWTQTRGPQTRQGGDATRLLQMHRPDLVNAAVRALREQVRMSLESIGGKATAPATPGAAAPGSGKLVLSLIDEDAVSADIEQARAVERIKSMAEFELRELQSFTSALVGDFNVSRDTNPFRPDTWVRALWDGLQAVPLPPQARAALLHDVAEPLARTLRQSYAAACARLDEQGVEPAAYRTIVVSPSARVSGDTVQAPLATTLNEMRESLPMPLDGIPPPLPAAAQGVAPAAVSGGVTTASTGPIFGAQAASSPGNAVDAQLIELLSRLFDAIQADRSVVPTCLTLLLRLHPTALRLAMQDARMLEDYDHPVWRFMDRLSHLVGTAPASDIERSLSYARQLIDHLVADGQASVARFEWALGRLEAFERHGFERALNVAQPEILQLQLDVDSQNDALDVGTLDTVPAELMDEPHVPDEDDDGTAAVPDATPGEHMRAYLQGDWRLLQLLWIDRTGQTWLLRDVSADQHWALRLPAIEKLFAAHLAMMVRPPSLVRSAAARVLRALKQGRAVA